MGYGKAEALLYFKHPYRFNLLGQSQWFGRIYGDFTMAFFSPRPIVYHGVFGRGLFQTLYEPPASPFTYLPFTLEWNLVAFVLLAGAVFAGDYQAYAAIPLLISLLWSCATAWRAKVEPRFDGFRSRLLIAVLVYLGPLVRSAQRYLWRGQMNRVDRFAFEEVSQRPEIHWSRWQYEVSFWSEKGLEKENFLHQVMTFLIPRKYLITIDQGWNDWDIAVHRGTFAHQAEDGGRNPAARSALSCAGSCATDAALAPGDDRLCSGGRGGGVHRTLRDRGGGRHAGHHHRGGDSLPELPLGPRHVPRVGNLRQSDRSGTGAGASGLSRSGGGVRWPS
jgi:hypothetical protein